MGRQRHHRYPTDAARLLGKNIGDGDTAEVIADQTTWAYYKKQGGWVRTNVPSGNPGEVLTVDPVTAIADFAAPVSPGGIVLPLALGLTTIVADTDIPPGALGPNGYVRCRIGGTGSNLTATDASGNVIALGNGLTMAAASVRIASGVQSAFSWEALIVNQGDEAAQAASSSVLQSTGRVNVGLDISSIDTNSDNPWNLTIEIGFNVDLSGAIYLCTVEPVYRP